MCKFGYCDVDLFASRLNNKLDRYVSFRPDPGAEAIDAFSYDWSINKLYIFPPFRLVGRVLQKIVRENVEAVIVLTLPLARRFASLLMGILVARPLLIPSEAIFLPYREQELHPLGKKLQLLACSVSSLHGKNTAFLKQQKRYLDRVGRKVHRNSTRHILRDGHSFVNIERLTL